MLIPNNHVSAHEYEIRYPELYSVIACPICKSLLNFASSSFVCPSCHRIYPQSNPSWMNLVPEGEINEDEQWFKRQAQMEEWYKDFIADSAYASNCLLEDYAPYVDFLQSLSGTVLDIGGGVGIVRHFLPAHASYVTLDPSLSWFNIEWNSLSDAFPCLNTPPCFVRGIGEHLPFLPNSFDAVVAFWSLNHSKSPKDVLHEVARILRPGGRLLLVLEDMPPSWRDLADRSFPVIDIAHNVFGLSHITSGKQARLLFAYKRFLRNQWPLQADHIRIWESDLRNWCLDNFAVVRRKWDNHFLSLQLQKMID